MKLLVSLSLGLVLFVSAAPFAAPQSAQQPNGMPVSLNGHNGRTLPTPNYDLASRWTTTKVGRYVFSTAVTPRWLEFSDRFWYNYETPAGQKWWIVDPIKKTKTPLLDNAKMASQLTRILRTPYDAQHLPISTIRFIEKDTKIRFSVTLPRDSRVENAAGEELLGTTQQEQNQLQGGGGRGGRGGGGRGGQQQQGDRARRRPGATPPASNATWWLEYDIATETVDAQRQVQSRSGQQPNWANISPDKKTIVFARGFNLFMMDAENFELAKKNAADPAIVETQLTTDGVEHYSFGRGRGAGGGQQDQQQDVDGGQQGEGRGGRQRQQSEADKKFGAAHQRRQRLVVAGQHEVLGVAQRLAQSQRPVGHQLAREPSADARDLQVRHAG